jgi:imidazolonepropionase-like amidohydrolase
MSDYVLVGGRLIDGTGSAPRTASVHLSGDRIVAVGDDADVALASDASIERIDVTGLTVMPGLIDAHVHITLGEPSSNDELFYRREPATSALLAAYNARKVLQAGVTSFLDVDGLFNIGPALRDSIDAGIVEGPTMKSGTYALMTAVGGTAGRFIPDQGTAAYAEVVRDRDEMIRVVRRQVKDGSDVIKIHVTGSIPARSGEIQVWTREELKVVCDTAHDLGVRVGAHCRGDDATLDSIKAGCDIIWHASHMGEASLEAMIEHDVLVAPVFTFLANLADHGARVGASPTALNMFRSEMEQTGSMLRRAYDAGVPLMCGSESGFSITPYGDWHAREMEVFVEHMGLTPLEAITCGTATSARALGQHGEVGTVEPGRRADILVLEGDPSVDISVLGDKSNFRRLFCRGQEVELAPVPPRAPLRGETTMQWSTETLTWDLVHRRPSNLQPPEKGSERTRQVGGAEVPKVETEDVEKSVLNL